MVILAAFAIIAMLFIIFLIVMIREGHETR